MSTNFRNIVFEELRLQREENARENLRRMQEAYEKDPRIKQLTEERHRMILSGIESVFKSAAGQDLEKAMLGYNQKIRGLLVENGFPEDYLQPVSKCPLCSDTGYVDDLQRIECECVKQRISELQCTVSSSDQCFEHFDINIFPDKDLGNGLGTQREHMALVRDFCLAYAEQFPRVAQDDLLFMGDSGLGKTYLLSCIARKVASRGFRVTSVTAYQALEDMRNAFFGRDNNAQDLFDADLLILDDLGMEPLLENVTVEQIYNLINTRRNAGKPIIVSTNLKMLDIKKRYTERVFSRLFDQSKCRIITLYGQDVRLIAK